MMFVETMNLKYKELHSTNYIDLESNFCQMNEPLESASVKEIDSLPLFLTRIGVEETSEVSSYLCKPTTSMMLKNMKAQYHSLS